MKSGSERLDYRFICGIIEPGSRVLDLGCGQGDLMSLLCAGKDAKVQGIELDEEAIYRCVENGLSVFHGDIDSGLSEYPDKSFDYVLLNQSLQQVKRVDFIIEEALRVGKRVVVGFPNFAHWRARLRLGLLGRSPVTEALPYNWYETPNLRFLSISDFTDYCKKKQIRIERKAYLTEKRRVFLFPNFFAYNGLFVISRGG